MAIDRKKWSSGPMVEALKAMFLVDLLGVQKLLSEIRPIRIEGSDPNVPILCPMESVWASETSNLLKESTEKWIIMNPRYFFNNKE